MTIKKWEIKLKKGEAFCYIKPTRRIHESGYRIFECGYIISGENKKCKEKIILGERSDHISLSIIRENKNIYLNLDLTKDGYIRIFSDGPIKWGIVVSSAFLEILK